MRLENRVAIVTGGASGIGRMIGRKFADEGASVVVADQDEEASDSAVAELKTTGAECTSYRLDVSVADETEGLVEAVRERFGHIDVLANCAGVSRFGPIEELRLEWWQRVIEVNLNGLFYCCYAVAKVMMEQKRGSIINIGSLAAVNGISNQAPYVASKHGVVGVTKALAIDLGPYQIRVNCICPATTMTRLALETRSEEFIEAEAELTPLRRLAVPEDIAKVAVFLASDDAGFVTGAVLPVDGGRLAALRTKD